MTEAYYYRRGKPVFVHVLTNVHAARLEDERSLATVSAVDGWAVRRINARTALLVQSGLLASAERASAPSVTTLLRRAAARSRAGERSSVARPSRAGLTLFPVASHAGEASVVVSSGDVVVQLQERVSRTELDGWAQALGWFVVRPLPFLANGYVLRAERSADPFSCANQLIERHAARLAHPVFLETIPDRAATPAALEDRAAEPGLSLVERQWHLRNLGQRGSRSGTDVAAHSAWVHSKGSSAIVACVIDSGINVRHDVFSARTKCIPGYDFTDGDSDPAPSLSSHGTSCAALVLAGPGSGSTRGVAPECTLMPVRRPDVANHLDLAEAFVWSSDHGADVLSCSFGIDGQPWVLPDVVRAALQYVTTEGRQGKGCPIFWAAGNGAESVTSDEWASSEFTIAVAASTDQATRAPYSDYGPEISLAAPSSGGANGIVTADNGGYTYEFGGTSAAAPIAAGVACLVLSLAPELRWREVKEVLQSSARRIDAVSGAYDATGHSPYYGYGQVDADAALRAIPALLVLERRTSTEDRHAGLAALSAYLQAGVGQTILDFLEQRRLGLLRRVSESPELELTVGRALRAAAGVGLALSTHAPASIPDEIWPDIERVVAELLQLPPLAPPTL